MVANVDFNITYVSDPGHGYLIVTPQQIQALGLTEDSFSQFSFKNNERNPTQYALEEDCDAFKVYCQATNLGVTLNITEEYVEDQHAVRGWPSIPSIPF